jgi:Family of unknown function (DUF6009)
MSTLNLDLSSELAIVWLYDLDDFDYVRESEITTTGRRNNPTKGVRPFRAPEGGRVIGYSILHPTAPARSPFCFERRIFWVKDYDRSESIDTPYAKHAPYEAVDPRTVAAGQPGTITKRAWGTPLPTAQVDEKSRLTDEDRQIVRALVEAATAARS